MTRVKWRQGMWSKEENDILKENIQEYCKVNNITDPNTIIFDMSKDDRKDFYRTIAKGIKRPLFAIYRRVLRMYDRRNYIGKYTPEEVKQLKALKEKHGNDWATIGIAMGRSASSVKDRYRLLRENCQSGKWTAEEEERLSNAVHELSGTQTGEVVTTGISWSSVAEKVQTRSEKQCRSKWLNYLNWKEKGGNEWTKQDEIKLINKIYEMDVEDENMIDWKGLMTNWTSVRSPQWLRSKWWALKKHIPSNSQTFREMVEYLHVNYVDTLQTKIERQESRYKNNRLSHCSYGSVLRNIHRPAQSNITHTITVSSDGSIVSKGDDSSHGFTNQGRFEVLQLNSVPTTEGNSQPNQLQPSYIIQSTSIAGQTYIIQQPALVDNGTVQGEQVQISPQGVVMTAVLHPHHAVRCLPEVNPELAQAIVQTDISGPIEATHLVQTELPVDQTQEQIQADSEISEQVHLTSLASQESLINDSGNHGIEEDRGDVHAEEVVTAVRDITTGMATATNNSLTTQRISSDGSIVSKGDDSSHGFTNQGRFEVLQLNSVPTTEGNSQPNQLQPSYIIQSTSIAGQTYIIQQPALVDNGTVQGEQVQISPQGVVMTAVLHPHHAVRCLPEVNPELAQAIVQTDISGPIEATHLVQTELPVDQTQEQIQAGSEISEQVHLTSLASQESLINDSGNHGIEEDRGDVHAEEVVTAVRDITTGMVTATNNSLTTQRSIIHEDNSNEAIVSTHYQQGILSLLYSY
ncbi:Cyclin-D-binding Myb-like transcription factor 1 [Exaiptasia diaphana]|nr:Cyclin-D-binding Myb-like transcription factor 1 [Exaiptasia diaphana]